MEDLLANRSSPDDGSPSSDGRKGGRTVHVKFKLSKDAMEAKEALAVHWDVSEKEGAEMAAQLTASFLKDEDEDTRHRFVERPATSLVHARGRHTQCVVPQSRV